jgi:membrane protease YdiL (CAAX protease family)
MIEARPPETRFVTLIALASEGLLAGIALAVGYFLRRPPLGQIDWNLSAIGYGLLATTPLLAGLLLITHYPIGPLKRLDEIARELLISLFRSCRMWELLLISLLAGFGEELLFRGALQAGLQQWTGSVWIALVIASALFGLAHPITFTYAVLAGAIGVYLGWLWLATDNLLVPMIAHAAYDFVALVYLLHRGQHSPPNLPAD